MSIVFEDLQSWKRTGFLIVLFGRLLLAPSLAGGTHPGPAMTEEVVQRCPVEQIQARCDFERQEVEGIRVPNFLAVNENDSGEHLIVVKAPDVEIGLAPVELVLICTELMSILVSIAWKFWA